jgi:hypothetical protein
MDETDIRVLGAVTWPRNTNYAANTNYAVNNNMAVSGQLRWRSKAYRYLMDAWPLSGAATRGRDRSPAWDARRTANVPRESTSTVGGSEARCRGRVVQPLWDSMFLRRIWAHHVSLFVPRSRENDHSGSSPAQNGLRNLLRIALGFAQDLLRLTQPKNCFRYLCRSMHNYFSFS